MERLLITKNGVAYSATTAAGTANSLTSKGALDTLKEGSIVGFQVDGTRVTAAGSFTPTEDRILLALGLPAGHATRISPLINRKTLKYAKTVYVAATKQITVIGDDAVTDRTSGAFAAGDVGLVFVCTVASTAGDFRATATALLKTVSTGVSLAADTDLVLGEKYEVIAAGTPDAWGGATLVSESAGSLVVATKVVGAEYGVEIVDLQKETWERRKYIVTTSLSDATRSNALMLGDIVAMVNAHPKLKLLVVASALGTTGIKLESVNAGEKFAAFPKGILYGTTVTSDGSGISQVAIAGAGTNAQILDLEARCNSVEGKTATFVGKQGVDIWTMPSLVETGVNYTVYVLEWTDQREVAYPSNNAHPSHKRLNIAVPQGDATMITAIDNILADLVA